MGGRSTYFSLVGAVVVEVCFCVAASVWFYVVLDNGVVLVFYGVFGFVVGGVVGVGPTVTGLVGLDVGGVELGWGF